VHWLVVVAMLHCVVLLFQMTEALLMELQAR